SFCGARTQVTRSFLLTDCVLIRRPTACLTLAHWIRRSLNASKYCADQQAASTALMRSAASSTSSPTKPVQTARCQHGATLATAARTPSSQAPAYQAHIADGITPFPALWPTVPDSMQHAPSQILYTTPTGTVMSNTAFPARSVTGGSRGTILAS